MTIDFNAEAAQAKADIARLSGWLNEEQNLFASQQNVMNLLHAWPLQAARKNETEANARLEDADKQLAEAHATLDSASPDRAEKAAKKVRKAEEERRKREAKLNHAQTETARHSTVLEAGLRHKSDLASKFLQSFANDTAPPTSVPRVAVSSPASPAAAVQEPSAGSEDVLGQLERLAALHKEGALTDEEFAAKKTDLLSRL